MSFHVTQALEENILAFVQNSHFSYCTSKLFALGQYQVREACIYNVFVQLSIFVN